MEFLKMLLEPLNGLFRSMAGRPPCDMDTLEQRTGERWQDALTLECRYCHIPGNIRCILVKHKQFIGYYGTTLWHCQKCGKAWEE
jgi:hypothetical protein